LSTDSTTGARDHARSHVRTATMRIPATPPDVDPSRLLWAEAVPPGSYATRVLGRGTRLRLIDPDGGACAHLLLFRSEAPWERLNVADTMKVPWQAYLGAGHPLLSDQGRVLATVVADSSGHHDTLCGMTDAGGAKMLLAAIKHGLDIRDVAPSVSLFKGVRVGDDGTLGFTGSAGSGASVDLLPWWLRWSTPPTRWTPTRRSPASMCWPGAPAISSPPPSTTVPNTCVPC
jgi:uncharacterized protein